MAISMLNMVIMNMIVVIVMKVLLMVMTGHSFDHIMTLVLNQTSVFRHAGTCKKNGFLKSSLTRISPGQSENSQIP